MATLTIKNIGPIKSVENLELNKVNVFMGPQSSGKSTIAKIISYCAWIEKDIAIYQSLGEYHANGNFKKRLEDFHRLNGYFKENTQIFFESEVIKLEFKNNECSIKWKDRYAYKRRKIEYIPSERNLITLPFIQKVEMPNNNNRSFLFDWLSLRTQYNKDNRVKILDLPVEYYYDEGTGENHITSINEKDKYDVLLENASSGLQSLTPLIVTLKYLTEWIYKNEEEISFEKQQRINTVNVRLMQELILEPLFGEISTSDEMKNTFDQLNELIKNQDSEAIKSLKRWSELTENLRKTFNSQFIIEEPEQNLFPSTQKELIYHLLKSLVFDRGDRVTITTHSPYILYALNNCMMGFFVNSQLHGEEKTEYLTNRFPSEQSWIDPNLVSIWEIEDGELRNIQDKKDNIISENYFDQKMTELTDEYFQMLTYSKDQDEE